MKKRVLVSALLLATACSLVLTSCAQQPVTHSDTRSVCTNYPDAVQGIEDAANGAAGFAGGVYMSTYEALQTEGFRFNKTVMPDDVSVMDTHAWQLKFDAIVLNVFGECLTNNAKNYLISGGK